jgi:hypothetical protein
LQRALQTATTRMLSSETSPGTPPAAAQFAAAAAVEPMHSQASNPQATSGSGGSLFEGLSVGDKPNASFVGQRQQAAVLPSATMTRNQSAAFTPPQPTPATLSLSPASAQSGKSARALQGTGGIGGMFSGLDLMPEGSSAGALAPPAARPSRSYSAASSDITALEASAMKGNHMSAERSQLGSATGALSTAGSAADPLSELLSPPISPHGGMPLGRP